MSGIQQMFFSKVALSATSLIGILSGYSVQHSESITVDSDGNFYACGWLRGAIRNNMVTVKFNSIGVIQWQKTLDLANSEVATSIRVSSSGNVYVCGNYNNGAKGAGIICKYNSAGTLQWQRNLSGVNTFIYGIALDSSENVYVCGDDASSPQIMVYAKYNSSGALQQQIKLYDTTASTRGRSISIDTSNNIYVFGSSDVTGGNRFQLAKYNSSGTLQWQRNLGNAGSSSFGESVTTDSSGNVYVCGINNTSAPIIQLAKYDSSGTLQWQRSLSSGAVNSEPYGIACDSSGNVYICATVSISGTAGVQIAKYDSSGTIQWQRRLTAGSTAYGYSIFYANGNIFICGDSGANMLIASLPVDGSKTGTYTVGSTSCVYSASSLTDAATTLTQTLTGLSSGAASLTDSLSTLGDTTPTLTSTVTTL